MLGYYICLMIGGCVGFVACALIVANGKDDEHGAEWIPVADRLPKAGEDVLVVVHDGYDSWADTDELMKDGRWLYFRKDRYVTHWMPLPEPPMEA